MIVIISVLASITVVAFNGVQKRSQEAQVNSAVKSSIKLVELALAKGVTPVGGNSCITTSAADYPVTADFASGACLKIEFGPLWGGASPMSIAHTPAVNNALFATGEVPAFTMPRLTGSDVNDKSYTSRGMWLAVTTSPREIQIIWLPVYPGKCIAGADETGSGGLCIWERSY